jgi:hypothetical protein
MPEHVELPTWHISAYHDMVSYRMMLMRREDIRPISPIRETPLLRCIAKWREGVNALFHNLGDTAPLF